MMVSGGITSGLRRVVWKTHVTCSQLIHVALAPDGRGVSLRFGGGYQGNTTGICSPVKDRKATEAKQRLGGQNCGARGTSCPDQLAQALEAMKF